MSVCICECIRWWTLKGRLASLSSVHECVTALCSQQPAPMIAALVGVNKMPGDMACCTPACDFMITCERNKPGRFNASWQLLSIA